jgi:hypothetical protein
MAKYGRFSDRYRSDVSRAVEETNRQFGTNQGPATLDGYTPEQKMFFVRSFFNDQTIKRVRIRPEPNVFRGGNEFYIEGD